MARRFTNVSEEEIMAINPFTSEATRISDCTQVCKIFSKRLYADDSSLAVSRKNKDDLLYQINLE